MEYFAFTAITNKSYHFSHSVLGGHSATSQYAGYPDTADAPPAPGFPPASAGSRSAMLKDTRGPTVKLWMNGKR